MKPTFVIVASLFISALHSTVGAVLPERPSVTDVRLTLTNILITVDVPPGLRKVTLESRERIGVGAWVPRFVIRVDGAGGGQTFSVPRNAAMEIFRVRADESELFPDAFYAGIDEFVGMPAAGAGPVYYRIPVDAAAPEGETREVVESDIWKIDGDRLYFFNQYRGLQIIDLSAVDAPELKGTLNLPAAGEQMYLVQEHAILLARDCQSVNSESALVVATTSDGNPQVVTNVPVSGVIQESRLVGKVLYVASETYRPVNETDPVYGASWEVGTVVTAFDLSNPGTPVVRGTTWYAGSGNVVWATDRFLFIALHDRTNWWQSIIHVVDISDPTGTMRRLSEVRPTGRIADKFKMNIDGDVFTAVSEIWSADRRWLTTLETFTLANPEKPEPLGKLEIKPGERLFATRFDGPRAYVVTFLQIDPLFVIDLSDARNPRIAGELEVPGWSTYIHPLGERLVAIGIDNTGGFRVAVSLFDVADPARPQLLSRVPVGENHSWSEATTDEKAFAVLPEMGLLLVPYQGYTTNGYSSRVQLIDLGETNLVARGVIEHQMQPRRAALHGGRVLSISGWELVSAEISDRDQPVIRDTLELAWRVDQVFVRGDHLLELAGEPGWSIQSGPLLRVASAAAPDRVLGRFELSKLPVLGASANGDLLYVLQGETGGAWLDGTTEKEPASKLTLSLIDLSRLPELSIAGSVERTVPPLGWTSNWKPLWLSSGHVVWSAQGGGWWRAWDTVLAQPEAASLGIWWPWPWAGGAGRLLGFDVTDQSAPRLLSDLILQSTNRWSFSEAYSAGKFIYVSHETSEFIEGLIPPGYAASAPVIVYDPVKGGYVTNLPPTGTWMQRYYLDVVDYSDATTPTARPPVNVPGVLRGIAQNGELVYTVGPHFDTGRWNSDWTEWLDATAYDGVAAHWIDAIPLSQTWPHPVLVWDDVVFIGRPDPNGTASPVVETWRVSESGKFVRMGSTRVDAPAEVLAGFGSMLAVKTSHTVHLFNATTPAALARLASEEFSGCLWFDLAGADGLLEQGLWIPLDDFGVARVPVR